MTEERNCFNEIKKKVTGISDWLQSDKFFFIGPWIRIPYAPFLLCIRKKKKQEENGFVIFTETLVRQN